MENQTLVFKMEGKQFEEGFNLHYLILGLDNFQKTLEKSYLTIRNKNRISENDRKKFQIKALKIQKGSFLTEIGIYLLATQMTFSQIDNLSPKGIVELLINGYEYLKFVLTANFKEEQVVINTGDNSNILVINNSDNTRLEVPMETLGYVRRAETNFEKIAQMIDPEKGVNNVSFFNKNNLDQNVTLTPEDKELFASKTVLENDLVNFKGTIFKADGNELSGKMIVSFSQDNLLIMNKEYFFEFINKNDIEKLKNAFMKTKTFTALKETVFDSTTLMKTVKKLQIVDVE